MKWLINVGLIVALCGCGERARRVHYLPGAEEVYAKMQPGAESEDAEKLWSKARAKAAQLMRHHRAYKRGDEGINDYPYLSVFLLTCALVDAPVPEQTVEYLLSAGADVRLADEDGMTPLHVAAQAGDAALCSRLLAAGADVNACDKDGWTPLMMCCALQPDEGQALEVCRALLAAGAVVNADEGQSSSPLIAAAEQDYTAVCAMLIEAGADVNYSGMSSCSAYEYAWMHRNRELIHLLETAGVEHVWRLPQLHEAIIYDTPEDVRRCVNGGVDVNERDSHGHTPLMYALLRRDGATEVCETLLSGGADANARNARGLSPLAVALGHESEAYALCKMLLDAGASPDAPLIARRAKAPDGEPEPSSAEAGRDGFYTAMLMRLAPAGRSTTPLQAARAMGREDICRLLTDAQSK